MKRCLNFQFLYSKHLLQQLALKCHNFDKMLVAAFIGVKKKKKRFLKLIRCNYNAGKVFSLCSNVFQGYVVLEIYLDAFWQMIWGESLSIILRFICRIFSFLNFCGYVIGIRWVYS